MKVTDKSTSTSLWSSFSLAVLGTTCCALPIALVALGMGSSVASLVSVWPWLAWLSQYKAITFFVTALVLAYSGWELQRLQRLGNKTQCSVKDSKRLKWQKRLLRVSTFIFGFAVFAAYALLPITLWWDSL